MWPSLLLLNQCTLKGHMVHNSIGRRSEHCLKQWCQFHQARGICSIAIFHCLIPAQWKSLLARLETLVSISGQRWQPFLWGDRCPLGPLFSMALPLPLSHLKPCNHHAHSPTCHWPLSTVAQEHNVQCTVQNCWTRTNKTHWTLLVVAQVSVHRSEKLWELIFLMKTKSEKLTIRNYN